MTNDKGNELIDVSSLGDANTSETKRPRVTNLHFWEEPPRISVTSGKSLTISVPWSDNYKIRIFAPFITQHDLGN